MKNLFGTVPGMTKFGYHVKLQTADRFAEMLLDLVSFVRPVLTVMDAVVGMDGSGPSAGRPFPVGAVLVSPDPVALDVAALGLVGQVPASVPTVARAIERGWTSGRIADLRLLGGDVAGGWFSHAGWWKAGGGSPPPSPKTLGHGATRCQSCRYGSLCRLCTVRRALPSTDDPPGRTASAHRLG